MRTITVGGLPVLIYKNSLQINERVNERTTASFSIIEPAFTVEVGAEVVITQGVEVIFAGTVDQVSEYDWQIPSVAVSCVDFSQLADKRLFAATFVNEYAGDIVRTMLADVLNAEGITEGDVQLGPLIAAAVFPYENCNTALNTLAQLAGYSWDVGNDKRLHFFERSTYAAPYGLTATSANFHDLQVKKTRSMYRNRQYVQAGTDLTSPISLEMPTPKPDGVSRTFTVRLPIGVKPQIYIDSVEVAAADIGIGGLETGKLWYWNKGKNTFSQDSGGTPLSTEVLEITYKGMFPILLSADDPVETAARQAIESGTGIHEGIAQQPSLDSQDAAMAFAEGMLEKYGYIPRVLNWKTYDGGLMAGQLISVNIPEKNIVDDFLIESVNVREDSGVLLYDVKALDGSVLGGWEQVFKGLLQGGRKLVIRENEVLILLNKISEVTRWMESTIEKDKILVSEDAEWVGVTTPQINACPLPDNSLYPSASLVPC